MLWLYPFVMGQLFGVVQTNYFLQLNFALASTYETFLLVTLSWLVGIALGLRLRGIGLRYSPWLCFLPYLATQALLTRFSFRGELWPLYAGLILCSGLSSGLLFAQLSKIMQPVRRLFFAENNGFVLGIVICTVIYLIFGRGASIILGLVLAVLSWLLTPTLASPR